MEKTKIVLDADVVIDFMDAKRLADLPRILPGYDFVILDEHQSPYTKSEYYTLVKKSQYDKQEYRYVLFIRLSDHDTDVETKKSKMRYYSAKADGIKQPTNKNKQVWRLKEITVNNQHYTSYEDALDDIDKRLRTAGN